MAAQSAAIPVSATGVVFAGPCTLRGFYISSTAGADVVIYDNASSAAGTILAQFTLAAKGDRQIDISDGVRCLQGMWITTTAAVQGNVRIG